MVHLANPDVDISLYNHPHLRNLDCGIPLGREANYEARYFLWIGAYILFGGALRQASGLQFLCAQIRRAEPGPSGKLPRMDLSLCGFGNELQPLCRRPRDVYERVRPSVELPPIPRE